MNEVGILLETVMHLWKIASNLFIYVGDDYALIKSWYLFLRTSYTFFTEIIGLGSVLQRERLSVRWH